MTCMLMYLQARRSSQSEAVALQAIRNAKGNGQCVDCEAPSEFLNYCLYSYRIAPPTVARA